MASPILRIFAIVSLLAISTGVLANSPWRSANIWTQSHPWQTAPWQKHPWQTASWQDHPWQTASWQKHPWQTASWQTAPWQTQSPDNVMTPAAATPTPGAEEVLGGELR
ncbi:uncharacterized protein BDZ99DRAFT_463203 [Mytilinidion resinicola]|uniref:Uncharacterized protein n=1 Tax=Mytilinidion resinicola TaxID=574789 RepID=A0A6A6YMZ3_9PEZI|nr:uncharacterized protein BDZ99DRAFT_463203 [Mytilinidion resinicola]KAF2809374.1 hypothetical protein BDZ99DRAFT_463203 [Mytilinidion resinicola]